MEQTTELANIEQSKYFGDNTSMSSLVLEGDSMDKLVKTAELMASSKVTIPAHLRNSPGDCLAVVMQAVQWGMNPFAIAQKTHLSQGGQLGYEAQLINAVVVASRALTGQPDFEFFGDWKKILGKVVEQKSDKGGKYYVAGWDKKDEEGLGVVVSGRLRGEDQPRKMEVLLTQCYPRFSTQWATDPQQQITYAAVRKFARRNAPGAILGVYTAEELDETPMKEINEAPRPRGGDETAKSAKAKPIVIDAAQEEHRNRLCADLLLSAEQGLDTFNAHWVKIGTTHKPDIYLIGQKEYERLLGIAQAVVVNSDAD